MRFGINTFLFTASFKHADTRRLFPSFKQWGFDSVEIAVENPDNIDPGYVKAQLGKHGLVCGSVTPCLGPDKDLRGTLQQQKSGVKFLKGVVDTMVALDAATLVGVVYSTVGRADAVPKNEFRRQWKTVVKNLKE